MSSSGDEGPGFGVPPARNIGKVPTATPPDPELRDRLVPSMPGSTLWGWAGPLLVTLFGAFLRFNRLGLPRAVLFDETFYVPDAYSILRHGVEIDHVKNVNALLARGNTHILEGTRGEYVAQDRKSTRLNS